ncbi:MAG: hypothetical protein IH892_11190 [Planctomycetes bacterium]|nr:hypothetical protein [Planctomycetota bacterium]
MPAISPKILPVMVSAVYAGTVMGRVDPPWRARKSWPGNDTFPNGSPAFKNADVTAYVVPNVVFSAAIAGVANTLMMSAFERTHEFGMLLAVDCGPKRIVR